MSDWVLVPCLVTLRSEFNAVAPNRDKGADGSIGDSNHTSASDHTPDEDSDILRDHDADSKNEVHALDIDSSGPWPSREWFEFTILDLVAREKAEFQSPTMTGRLQYVIWNRRIASRSWGWTWRAYSGADPHTNHAHFSARYLTSTESDTRPWGVKEEDMPVTPAEMEEIAQSVASKLYADLKNPKSGLYTAVAERSTAGAAAAITSATPVLSAASAKAVIAALGSATTSPEQVAAILKPVLGANASAVGAALQK